MAKKVAKIKGTTEAWEDGLLGRDEEFAQLDTSLTIDDLEETLELQQINIRLKKSVIAEMKMFADIEGLGYQALIKQLLDRFIAGEHKRYTKIFYEQHMKEVEEASEDDDDLKCA